MARIARQTARILLVLAAAVGVAGLALDAEARPAKRVAWTLLGERTVTDRVDRDTIRVTVREGTFRKLRLAVKRRAVEFHDMKVHFANGDVVDIPMRKVVPAGGRSRVIDLPGARRVITKVVFTYDAQSFAGGKAVVQLYGRR